MSTVTVTNSESSTMPATTPSCQGTARSESIYKYKPIHSWIDHRVKIIYRCLKKKKVLCQEKIVADQINRRGPDISSQTKESRLHKRSKTLPSSLLLPRIVSGIFQVAQATTVANKKFQQKNWQTPNKDWAVKMKSLKTNFHKVIPVIKHLAEGPLDQNAH